MDAEDLNILNIIRTGSMWTKTSSYWAGKPEDQMCVLCNKEKETPEHVLWVCECLKDKRVEHDKEIAALDPAKLPQAIKFGIAPQ